MLRTAANRVGCVFWSAAQPTPSPRPSTGTPQGPSLRASADAPQGPSPRASTEVLQGPSQRAVAAAQLVSHPLAWEASDCDLLEPDLADLVDNLYSDSEVVTPQPTPQEPPPGLRVGFEFMRDIAAPIQTLVQVICDSDCGHAWIDRCVESRLLQTTSTGPIAYHRYKLPVLGDRDSVTRSTLETIDAHTIKITVQPWNSADVEVPPGTVRLPWLQGSFTLVAKAPELTSVCHASQLVLGGGIPGILGPVIRRQQQKSPDITLRRLAALVASAPATTPGTQPPYRPQLP